MRAFYLLFAVAAFGLFCFLEFRGTSLDATHPVPKPQYYSYRGGSSGGFYAGTSGFSHK